MRRIWENLEAEEKVWESGKEIAVAFNDVVSDFMKCD